MDIEFRPADPSSPPASDLIETMASEVDALYGRRPDDPTRVLDPASLVPPAGVYLVGWVRDVAAAGGGLRPHGPGVCEIKRMYVAPAFRRRGYAGRLLAALEAWAVDLGYHTARLDTGPRQPDAQALYRSRGYLEIARYNENWHADFWGQKQLSSPMGATNAPSA